MAPMPDPQDKIPSFSERHSRVTSMLYQISLCIVTFFLAITIRHYGPKSEVLDRVERICPNGAREDKFEIRFLAVYLLADNYIRMILIGRLGRNAPFHGLPFNYNIYHSRHPLPYRHY
jgi:hypothetical protein